MGVNIMIPQSNKIKNHGLREYHFLDINKYN